MRTNTETTLNENEIGTGEPTDRRKVARTANVPKISVVVKGKDEGLKPWSETAEVTSLSTSGAGLFMKAECPVGRLVALMMPMPLHLRRYDQDKRLYRVWGLVQYCYEAGGDEQAGFHAGVALIGKDAPSSYGRNPMTSYRVCGMDKNGLWKIEELETSFKQRASTRYWNSLDVSLYQLDDEQHSIAAENTVTENISETGALVFSELRVSVGDRIKLQSNSPPFSSLSIVRHRRLGADDRHRIHLEFVENNFPILEIEAPIEEDGEH
jgi:hypothetical protein